MRTLTLPEFVRLGLLAERVRSDGYPELADALIGICRGDEGAYSDFHDALNVAGEYTLADRLRKLVRGS